MSYSKIPSYKKKQHAEHVIKGTGALLALAGIFISLSLVSYNATDPSWFMYDSSSNAVANVGGILGSYTAALCFYFFGTLAYLFVAWLLYVSHCLLTSRYRKEVVRIWLVPCMLITLCTLVYYYGFASEDQVFLPGGIVGRWVYVSIAQWCNTAWIAVIAYSALALEVLWITNTSIIVVMQKIHAAGAWLLYQRHYWFYPMVRCVKKVFGMVLGCVIRLVKMLYVMMVAIVRYIVPKQNDAQEQYHASYAAAVSVVHDNDAEVAHDVIPVHKNNAEHSTKVSVGKTMPSPSSYVLPSAQMFSGSEKQTSAQVSSEHAVMAKILEEKLSRFGISGSVTTIKPGPVVTLFEYQPAIDSKVSKIVALEHDLALALEAISVRICAPIPGTSKVGFEVSNKERKSVKMGDSIRSKVYTQSRALLPIIVGQDTSGEHIVVDLVDMPHLLVAGSTGSGKSVALNVMLASLLYKFTPEQLKLIIIDPKRLEFAAYHDIAHLLFPIITDPRKAAPITQWLVKTMEERYEYMAQKGVRNIVEYKRACQQTGEQDSLPWIVLMIDELADLMMVAGKDIETSIARLAQMARAAGIHLIIATQRPSVDVITGLIKVNFPSRMSFRVSSKIDSRTILDSGGAELLLGKGDMLYMDAQSARLRRVHGAYVSDTEIALLVDHIRQQTEPAYIDIQEALTAYDSAQMHDEQDPLLQDVVAFLTEIDEVSISLLQRKFKIGYNRSARLIELLEMQGKVMPSLGGKMRRVVK